MKVGWANVTRKFRGPESWTSTSNAMSDGRVIIKRRKKRGPTLLSTWKLVVPAKFFRFMREQTNKKLKLENDNKRRSVELACSELNATVEDKQALQKNVQDSRNALHKYHSKRRPFDKVEYNLCLCVHLTLCATRAPTIRELYAKHLDPELKSSVPQYRYEVFRSMLKFVDSKEMEKMVNETLKDCCHPSSRRSIDETVLFATHDDEQPFNKEVMYFERKPRCVGVLDYQPDRSRSCE